MVLVTVVAVAVFLRAIVGAATGDYPEQEGRHNLVKGSVGPGDRLLYSDKLTLTGKPNQVRSYDFCYPPKDSYELVYITHYNVEAVNKKGLAYLSKGYNALPNNRVCFHLKSPRGEGYHFKVRIFGR